jgi:8-amino-7-oxononanoate synthase
MTPDGFEAWLRRHRDARADAGLSRALHPRSASGDLIDLAGNDYLGLGSDPRVIEAAAEAARTWGAGAGASRLVTGSLDLHAELESALSSFTGRPRGLVLSTGYQANLATVASLCDPDTLVVSDAHVHASLVDACRLARHGGLRIVGHNDVEEVALALREWFGSPHDSPATRGNKRALVLVESVYSVDGDAAPLADLAAVVAGYDALLVVDEAHALGVSGPGGRGLVQEAGLAERTDIVVTATLSKALGSQGGVVLAAPAVIEHLVNTARPFIYDTGLAPSAAAGALAALQVIEAEPHLPARARRLATRLAVALGVEQPAGCVLSVPKPT